MASKKRIYGSRVYEALSADPSNPEQGEIYFSDGTARPEGFWQYKGGAWAEFGGGTGGLDSIFTEDHETNGISNYTTGNNATFDNGGVLDGTLALDTSTQIAGDQGLKYTMSTSSTNDWIASEAITVGEKEQGNVIAFKFHYKYDGADGDIKAVIYDATNSTVLTDSTASLEAASNAKMYSVSAYIPDGVTSLKLGFQVVTGNNTKILLVDDIELTHNTLNKIQSVNIEDMQSFTPTGNFTTNTNYYGIYWREGDRLHVRAKIRFTGTPNSATASLVLPNSLEMDTTKFADNVVSASEEILGYCHAEAGGAYHIGSVRRSNDTSVIFNGDDGNGAWSQAVPVTFGNTDHISCEFSVPIKGWTSANESVITPLTVVAPARLKNNNATAVATSTVTYIGFATEDFDKEGLFTNAGSANNTTYTSTTYYTAPKDGKYRVNAQLFSSGDADIDANEATRIEVHVNGSEARRGYIRPFGTISTPQVSWQINDIIDLNKDDKVSIVFYHECGADVTLTATDNASWFTVEKIDSNAKIHAMPRDSWTVKYLSADDTTSGTMSDLTCTLEIGATYRLGGVLEMESTGDDAVEVHIDDGATVVAEIAHNPDGPNNTTMSYCLNSIFTATTTSLTFTSVSAGSGSKVNGDGTRAETHVILERLNNHVEV